MTVTKSVLRACLLFCVFGFGVHTSWAVDILNGDFSKNDPLDVRVVSYNHNRNFIDDSSADAEFDRILTALNPDVICFQEFPSDISVSDVEDRMDLILPTPGGWRVHFGLLGGIRTVIASRYPLTQTRIDTVPSSSTRGVTIALVDLPDADYAVDLYLLGVHLKCCGDPGESEDDSRQDSADAIANWLGDARGVNRSSGNNIVLPANTPMIALGDFNLVGGPQPEDTIVTGDIQDSGTYGSDVKGDWDNSNLTNLNPLDPFTGDNFTWQGNSSFDPSPLDRMFYTDSVITVGASFVLNTDTMSGSALANAGLQSGDTLPWNTSDHLPIVFDARVELAGCADSDGDGVCDLNDVCPGADDNADADGDSVPDGCDQCLGDDASGDSDGDGVCDDTDPCPLDDPDDVDGDGVCDSVDICPGADDNSDADGDSVPDGCDQCLGDDASGDSDVDGVCDDMDPCPLDDPDDVDGDSVCDSVDICPGADDNADADGDSVPDGCDQCLGDDASGDSDGDGVCNDIDPCPLDDPDDVDGDGVCDSVDLCPGADDNADADGDSVPDGCDACPGFDDNLDADGDGIPDGCDAQCPGDTDGDGDVDLTDIAIVLGNFGANGAGLDGDLDADGDVDLSDLAIVLGNFGRSC